MDPFDDDTLYVTAGMEGLYISRDGGSSWEQPLSGRGANIKGFVIDPRDPNKLWALVDMTLYRSPDRGLTWETVQSFPELIFGIRSLHVSAALNRILVGPQWGGDTSPGVYLSTDEGASWTLQRFPTSEKGYILWDIEEDTTTGALYVSGEIEKWA